MRVKSILSSAIVISILLIQPTSAASPRYEIIDLGGEEAYSINEEGEVVGRAFYHAMPQGVHHAVLFDTTGGGNNIDLGTLAEGTHSCAWSINNRSQIVGYASTYGIHSMHATLFDSSGNGNNTDFLTLGGMESAARSINDGGQIIGYATNNLNMERATLFDPSGSGENIDLGTLGGDVSEAMSINNNGQIVGWAMDSLGFKIATIFDPTGNGDNLDLGTLGGNYSFALSINDKGQIVGSGDIASGDTHATLFDTSGNGNNVDLGTLGGNSSAALSINNKAEIVGISRTTYSYYKHAYHATLFDPSGNGNNIDLNALIDPNSGWILKEALSINDYRWIVGVGYNPEGRATACLLIPKPPKIIHVDDDANGANDGSSWTDAYNYLQDALAVAYSGDEIRVAQGIYTPDSNSADPNGSGDREATFQLINGVTIKGGYAGTGSPDPNARDIDLYETILSGDLANNDIEVKDLSDLWDEPCRAENSYHVITGSGTDANTLLDGFTITAGNDDQIDPDMGGPSGVGGGMYNRNGSPMLTNCTFAGNSANLAGGGMHNINSSPTLKNCMFSSNSTEYYGGGMCNTTGPGNSFSSPTLSNCIFSTNLAGDGAGMYNNYSRPTLVNCKFFRNLASNGGNMSRGGGMYSFRKLQTLTNCIFIGNVADYGGGIYNSRNSPMLTNCTFNENSAQNSGGAMQNYRSSLTITDCTFTENTSGSGGGICSADGNDVIINCVFRDNSANATSTTIGEGGGMANFDNKAVIVQCTFSGNSARHGGGGMVNYFSNLMITNCTFSSNYGGGMVNYSNSPMITNCIFSGNYYIIMINCESSPILINCTLHGNSTSWYAGAGIYSYYYSQPTITNCVLWNDGNEIWNDSDSTIEVTYSDVQGGWPGEGNIDSDPLFVDPGYWDANGTPDDVNDDFWVDGDYHLLPGSPCIDTGDPNYVAEPNETDLEGRPRVIAGRIDMGAYEAPIFSKVRILPRTINLASKGKWITSYIWLSDDYDVADIEPNSVLLEDKIQPGEFSVDEQAQLATARFTRKDVQHILDIGEVELTITGRLTDGTIFEGADIIKVTDAAGKKPANGR